ncbi:MAG: heme ABC transporter permease, partial [Casimicrobiaceae bacterium]
SVSVTSAPRMATLMLSGMLVMALAAWCYSIAVALVRVRSIILERENNATESPQLRGMATRVAQ